MQNKPKNFLEQVSYSFKYGKEKAREEFSKDEELEEIKKKRKKALAMMESEKPKEG